MYLPALERGRRPVRCAPGFTVLELVIVLTVLAILAGMVLPDLGRTYRDAALRADARKVAAALGLAHSQAVTSSRLHRLRIDGGARRFWLERREDGGERGFVPALGVPGGEGTLDGAVAVTLREPPVGAEEEEGERAGAGKPEPIEGRDEPPREETVISALAFRPDGTADALEVLLEDGAGFALAVRVHPSTGRVRVVEVDRDREAVP